MNHSKYLSMRHSCHDLHRMSGMLPRASSTPSESRASRVHPCVFQVLTEAVKALRVPDYQRVTIDMEITNFHYNLAACERLFSQPIPIAYTRHTSR